jgi:hypothetical protein
MQALESRRGRPRKYQVPSRAVTLTLPEHVLDALAAIDPDLSRAIVSLAPAAAAQPSPPPAELNRFGRHAVIVTNPTRTLEERAGVELVPVSAGRALIAFPPSTTTAEIELLLEDALDDHLLASDDRRIFASILGIIRDARRSDDVSLLQRSIIVLEKRRPATQRKKR